VNDDPEGVDVVATLVEAARRVRPRRGHIPTTGLCRDICLATVVASAAVGESICVCYELITVNGSDSEHWWLRYHNTIVDPTADQYGVTTDVLVKPEGESGEPQYMERFFFPFRAHRVLSLAGIGV
jgi:hypothetical protein